MRANEPALDAWATLRRGALRSRFRPMKKDAQALLEQGRAATVDLGDLTLRAAATALHAETAALLHDEELARSLLAEALYLRDEARGAPTCLLGGELEEALSAAESAVGLEGRSRPLSVRTLEADLGETASDPKAGDGKSAGTREPSGAAAYSSPPKAFEVTHSDPRFRRPLLGGIAWLCSP